MYPRLALLEPVRFEPLSGREVIGFLLRTYMNNLAMAQRFRNAQISYSSELSTSTPGRLPLFAESRFDPFQFLLPG
jgi:hypothetical protein